MPTIRSEKKNSETMRKTSPGAAPLCRKNYQNPDQPPISAYKTGKYLAGVPGLLHNFQHPPLNARNEWVGEQYKSGFGVYVSNKSS